MRILEDHERVRWFFTTIATAAKWITSVAAASVVLIDAAKWGVAELLALQLPVAR